MMIYFHIKIKLSDSVQTEALLPRTRSVSEFGSTKLELSIRLGVICAALKIDTLIAFGPVKIPHCLMSVLIVAHKQTQFNLV